MKGLVTVRPPAAEVSCWALRLRARQPRRGGSVRSHPQKPLAPNGSSSSGRATGQQWPERPVAVGGSGFGSYMLLRWSAPLDLAALAIRGWAEPVGPLVEANPDVLITVARSDDGVSMQLAMEPADAAGGCQATLQFARLTPGSYRVQSWELQGRASVPGTDARPQGTGDDVSVTFEADADGTGSVTMPLDGPVRLTLDVATVEVAR